MNFLTNIITTILTAYLAFTNTLALEISTWYNDNFTVSETSSLAVEVDNNSILSLPSRIAGVIPDVLLRNDRYQQASLISSAGLTGATTDDPLDAIVNIFCTFTTANYVRTTTGTGFFIDPDGVIMTNAHVAQFLLLEETEAFGKAECVIRSGYPAKPQYLAELLYLSPAWIVENSTVISKTKPVGTGERDYALLYVSSRIDDQPLPAQFPALDFDPALLPVTTKNRDVTIAGYPATNLFLNGPQADLIPQKDTSTISELYTFGSNYADVFSIRGSKVGAEGSSGGPILNEVGKVIGVIVTRGDDTVDGLGSLRAITVSHINRTIQEETGFSLERSLAGNLPYRAQIFAETLTPFLSAILEQAN